MSMKKALRKEIGIKELRRQGLTYLERAKKIWEYKVEMAKRMPRRVSLAQLLPKEEVKVIRVSFWKKLFTKLSRFFEVVKIRLFRGGD